MAFNSRRASSGFSNFESSKKMLKSMNYFGSSSACRSPLDLTSIWGALSLSCLLAYDEEVPVGGSINGCSKGHLMGEALGRRSTSGMSSSSEVILTTIRMISLIGVSESSMASRTLFGPGASSEEATTCLFCTTWWSFLVSSLIFLSKKDKRSVN